MTNGLPGRVVRVEDDFLLGGLLAVDVLGEEAFALGIHLSVEVEVVDVPQERVHLLGQAGNVLVLGLDQSYEAGFEICTRVSVATNHKNIGSR